MATNESAVMTSHNLVNYSGMLFNKGNTKTPFSTIIGGRAKTTDHFEFTTGLEFETGGGVSQPAITETASLTAPTATFVTREQKTNVTQIFQEALSISYMKQSDMGTLGGLNAAGQVANPASELDFQAAARMKKIARDIEYTFINGTYQKSGYDDVANKTRGMLSAITTNVVQAGGKGLGLWLVADALKKIYDSQGMIEGTILWCDATALYQLNADAKDNDLTIVPSERNVNGIQLSELLTPLGTVYVRLGECMPAGTVMLFNPEVPAPVYQPVPEKGNFFLEKLAKTGAAEKYQIYGQVGLDHGPEWYHAKITGLSTSFIAPASAKKVYIDTPVPTIEVDAPMTGVTLDKASVVINATATATPVLNIAPATTGTFAYEWQESSTATGTFSTASTLSGYQTATVTAPNAVPTNKFLRCKVTSSGTVEAAVKYSDAIEIVAS